MFINEAFVFVPFLMWKIKKAVSKNLFPWIKTKKEEDKREVMGHEEEEEGESK